MPSTKPKFMDEIIYNSSTQKYASLYFKSEKVDGSTTAIDQFYWINTDSAGVILDYRSNMLNGWSSSKATALANLPAGYSGTIPNNPTLFDTKNMVGYLNAWTHDGSVFPYKINQVIQTSNLYKNAIDAYVSALQNGANYITIAVNIDELYTNLADYTADTSNTNNNYLYEYRETNGYKNFDQWIKGTIDYIATTYGSSKAISFRLESKTNYFRAGSNGVFLTSEFSVDNLGNVSKVIYDFSSISLASTTGKAKVKNFLNNFLRRYVAYANSKSVPIYWVSLVVSQTSEGEYNYDNYSNGSAVPRLFDFSDNAVNGFKTWLQTRYSNISALNQAWGSSFASFSAIARENLPAWGVTDESLLNRAFAGTKGKDFYDYNFSIYTSFYNEVKSLINGYSSMSSSIRMMLETGSDTDEKAMRRLTFDKGSLKSFYDYHKTFAGIPSSGNYSYQETGALAIDYLRDITSLKKLGSEIYANDMLSQVNINNDITSLTNAMVSYSQSLIRNGWKDIMVISESSVFPNAFNNYQSAMNTISQVSSFFASNNTFVNPTQNLNISLAGILQNGLAWLKSQWLASGGSINNRIKITLTDSAPPTENCNYRYSPVGDGADWGTLSYFCLNSESISSTLYTDAQNLYAVKSEFYNTHIEISLPTHGVTYQGTTPVIVTYSITGDDGIVYVRMTQTNGFIHDSNSKLDNNHPINYNIVYTPHDARVYLPLNKNYTITMTSIQGTFTAFGEVVGLNTGSITKFRRKVSQGNSASYTFSANSIEQGGSIRILKLNCNRYIETDTWTDI